MEEVTISELRTHCYAILRRVHEAGRPVLVTRYGKPIGQIAPPPPEVPRRSTFGCMSGTMEIVGEIVEPLGTDDWEVYRECNLRRRSALNLGSCSAAVVRG